MEEGYNPAYGARPLRRAVMRLLEDSLAEEVLSGRVKTATMLVDVDDNKVVVRHRDRLIPPAARRCWPLMVQTTSSHSIAPAAVLRGEGAWASPCPRSRRSAPSPWFSGVVQQPLNYAST